MISIFFDSSEDRVCVVFLVCTYVTVNVKIFYNVTKEMFQLIFFISNGFDMFFQYNRFLTKGFL